MYNMIIIHTIIYQHLNNEEWHEVKSDSSQFLSARCPRYHNVEQVVRD